MNRLVYLFELDVAKTGRVDAENAEFVIFHEIIKNGNKVVMSMNQFVDSRVMTAAMYDENSFKYVRRLFDEGALKVSLYADVCSVSQYVQNAIDKCLAKSHDGYIFNTLPVKANDTYMLTEIKNALRYSDLTNVNKMLDAEYAKLGSEPDLNSRSETLENIRKLRIILRFLSLVLKLSVSAKGNNPAKPTEGRGFMDFMNAARETLRTSNFRRRDLNAYKARVLDKLDGALSYFDSEEMSDKQRCRRTNWIKYLTVRNKDDAITDIAVEIVNICYNYAVQDTIYGVSKRYDEENFEATFKHDFIRRVNRFWVLRVRSAFTKRGVEEAEYRLFFPKQWKRAAAISGYNADYHTVDALTPENVRAERKNWYALIMKEFGTALGLAAIYAAVFCLIGFCIDLINGALGTPTVGLIFSNLGGVIFVIVASVILSLFTKFPSALECAKNVVRHVANIINASMREYDIYAKRKG